MSNNEVYSPVEKDKLSVHSSLSHFGKESIGSIALIQDHIEQYNDNKIVQIEEEKIDVLEIEYEEILKEIDINK